MSLGRRVKRHLLTGFLVLAPLSISVFLLLWLVSWVDGLLSPVVYGLIGREVPGLGVMTALVLALGAGWLASNVIGQHILETIEDLVFHVPGLNWLYRTVKQLTEVFSPGGKAQFRSVVMVEYPRPGVFQLGFATGAVRHEEGGAARTLTSVYIPTNHLYIGDVILVPSAKVKETTMSLQQGVQFFLSAGATSGQKPHAGEEPLGM